MFSFFWRRSKKAVQLEETLVNSPQIGLIPWSIARNRNIDNIKQILQGLRKETN